MLQNEFPEEGPEDGEEEETEASAENRIGTEISDRFDKDESNLNTMLVNINRNYKGRT